jgi:hypothetical protein
MPHQHGGAAQWFKVCIYSISIVLSKSDDQHSIIKSAVIVLISVHQALCAVRNSSRQF